jgi:hypothetical protein
MVREVNNSKEDVLKNIKISEEIAGLAKGTWHGARKKPDRLVRPG